MLRNYVEIYSCLMDSRISRTSQKGSGGKYENADYRPLLYTFYSKLIYSVKIRNENRK